jgi:hypothetical protein
MPSLRLRFDSAGRPLICVEGKPGTPLQPSFQAHPPNVVPCFVDDFLIDTGATGCVVEDDLIAPWHLMKVMPVLTKSGRKAAVTGYAYPLSMKLWEHGQPDSWYHPAWPVSTVPTGHFGGVFKGLIGMDLLRYGKIHYDGPAGSCVLSWT